MVCCWTAVSPVHLRQGCCSLALTHRHGVWTVAGCLTGTGPLSIYDDLMYTLEINHLSGTEMAIGIIYEWHMQAYISWRLDAGLRYLQCISNGNASVLHRAISTVRAVAWCLTGARLLSMVYDDRMLAMWVELKCYNGIEMLQWYN